MSNMVNGGNNSWMKASKGGLQLAQRLSTVKYGLQKEGKDGMPGSEQVETQSDRDGGYRPQRYTGYTNKRKRKMEVEMKAMAYKEGKKLDRDTTRSVHSPRSSSSR